MAYSSRGSAIPLCALVLLCLVVAPPAFGATARVQNGVIVYASSGAVDNTLFVSGPGCFVPFGPCTSSEFRLLDARAFTHGGTGEAITPGPGCVRRGTPPAPGQPPLPWPFDHEVYCAATGVRSMDIDLGDGNDLLYPSVDRPVVVHGGAGRDELRGGAANDTLFGGPGDDTFFAGPGDDAMFGEVGADTYYALQCPVPSAAGSPGQPPAAPEDCNPPRDSALDTGGDFFSGGTGVDTANFSDLFADEALSVNGLKDDGKPGEGDNIASDVERISAGPFIDAITGNGAANQLEGGAGADSILGRGGADAVTGAGGDDDLDGGSGDDDLDGGDGEDLVLGDRGSDDLAGGSDVDLLRARNGKAGSTASCGSGKDFVLADPDDRVRRDCEYVDRVRRDNPLRGERVAVDPTGQSLRLKLPESRRFFPLPDHANLPVRSLIDATAGPVEVTAADPRALHGRAATQSATFSGGCSRSTSAGTAQHAPSSVSGAGTSLTAGRKPRRPRTGRRHAVGSTERGGSRRTRAGMAARAGVGRAAPTRTSQGRAPRPARPASPRGGSSTTATALLSV